ncbi:hypothetical protein AUJ78_01440 [Candidatus Peregrinibacteria bacterium CG1_02_41_10]|nr:MAG: hypothetical protein AUJ78_01440 [Candidatus Peregrinibacteria bacterium CG1_02_41_10]
MKKEDIFDLCWEKRQSGCLADTEVNDLLKTARRIEVLSEKALPPAYVRVILKEKLLSSLKPSFSWKGFVWVPHWSRKALALFTVICFLSLTYLLPLLAGKEKSQFIATLEVLFGKVSVVRALETKEIVFREGLKVGDIVQVKADSEAKIEFFNQSESVLKENTEVAINKVLIDPAGTKEGVIVLSLNVGTIANFIVEKLDQVSKLEINTPNSVVTGQNSSIFEVMVDRQGGTEVKPQTSEINITALDKGKNAIASAKGIQGYTLKIKNMPLAGAITLEKNTTAIPSILADQPIIDLPKATWDNISIKLDFVYVKLLQALKDLNRGNKIEARNNLLSYQNRLKTIFNLLKQQPNEDEKTDITTGFSTVLANSFLPAIKNILNGQALTPQIKNLISKVEDLAVLETGVQDKIALSLVRDYTQPIDMTALKEADLNSKDILASNLINLVVLKDTVTDESALAVDKLIKKNISEIVQEINELSDWKKQLHYLQKILPEIPDNLLFKEDLLVLKKLVPERFGYLIDRKVEGMR